MMNPVNPNRLLVVDDEPDICAFVKNVAEGVGFDVATATGLDEFRDGYESLSPSMIVIDLHMPEVDGVELLRFLAERHCAAQIILMSGFDPKILNTARQLGAAHGLKMFAVLRKPMTVFVLEAELTRAKKQSEYLSEGDLRAAIDERQLVLHYQPKVKLGKGGNDGEHSKDSRSPTPVAYLKSESGRWELSGIEALVRWEHPTSGTIPPARFIPFAEETGLIRPLTDYVIAAAMEQIHAWKEVGFTPSVAVNLSPHLFVDLEFPDRLTALVNKSSVDCSQITLEVTETGAMTDVGRTMDILSRLRLKGFALSMDDFGTGYSSMVQLYRMPFTEIKIDKSFVTELGSSDEAATIVRSILDLAHNLGTTVCAEGVETREAMHFLCTAKCDKCQGYYLGRPVPADKLMERVDLAGPVSPLRSCSGR